MTSELFGALCIGLAIGIVIGLLMGVIAISIARMGHDDEPEYLGRWNDEGGFNHDD